VQPQCFELVLGKRSPRCLASFVMTDYALPATRSELASNSGPLIAVWSMFFVTAGITYHTPPIFLPGLMTEFNATQYDISFLPSAFELGKGVFTLPAGFMVDRFGPSRCIQAGTLIITSVSMCYPFAWNLWLLGMLHGIYGVAFDLSGLPSVIVFATTWFDRQRASSIGICVTAFSLAGVAFPPCLALLIERWGWRVAAGACPVVMMGIVMPLAFGILRDGPLAPSRRHERERPSLSEPGPFPTGGHSSTKDFANRRTIIDGAEAAGSVEALGVESLGNLEYTPRSFAQSLRFGAVWHLAFLSLYHIYVVIALINTLVLYLNNDVGIPLGVCALYTSVVFFASIVGKLLAGVGLDTAMHRSIGVGSCLLLILGCMLSLDLRAGSLQPTSDRARLWIFAVVYGGGYGACYSVISSKPAKMFGNMPEFSKLQAFLLFFQVVGGLCGTMVTTKLRVVSGSYTAPFCIFVVMAFLGSLHYFALEFCAARAAARIRPQSRI